MRSILVLLVTLVTVVSCVGTQKKPSEDTTPVVKAINRSVGWTLSIPVGWERVEVNSDPHKRDEVVRVLAATKKFANARAALIVTLGRFEPKVSQTFAHDVLEHEESRADVQVVRVRDVTLGEINGTELFELKAVSPIDLVGIVMMAASKEDTSVLVACGCNFEDVDAVMPECVRIVESLRLE